MLMEILSAAAVVGIAVVLYPVLKFYNRTIALAYLGFRLIEPAITIVIILASLSILTLSQQYILAGAGDVADYALLGTLFQATRDWALMIYIMIFCTGAVLFYGLLYRTRLVPRLLLGGGLGGPTVRSGAGCVGSRF